MANYYDMDNRQQEIYNLTSLLESPASPIGDWKIAKYHECVLAGEEPPYDIAELHTRRQEVRDKITALQFELKDTTTIDPTHYWLPGDTYSTPPRTLEKRGPFPEDAIFERPAKNADEILADAKVERAAAVNKITVEVDGMIFDGDEKAQERMARAVVMADSLEEKTNWVLHDNTVAQVSAGQLKQACRLAGQKQTELWTVPYEG